MKNKVVSMQNIADQLKISISTVSFVLNGKAKEKHISAALTQKVLAYAKSVNYRPNKIAQSLRTGKSNLLVFMVEDISDGYFSKLASAFEGLAYNEGYKVIFCSNENNDDKAMELINFFCHWQADGFIIASSAGIQGAVKNLLKKDLPVILLNRRFENIERCSITVERVELSFGPSQSLQILSTQLIDLMLLLLNKENSK